MNIWWVNHKQTWNHEFNGGYLWSPVTNANGARNQFYDNMLRAKPGDLVFSYANGRVQGIGRVTAYAVREPKPAAFGAVGSNWSEQGWKLPVTFERFNDQSRISPKENIETIRPTLPERYSPIIGATGNGSMGAYLAEIPPEMFAAIKGLIGVDWDRAMNALHSIANEKGVDTEQEERALIVAIEQRTTLTPVERKQLIRARVGQGKYRERVLEVERACRITGVEDPRHLVASHIKPWRVSTDIEKLSAYNGLMLSPHVDHLFDKGYIGFERTGKIIVSSELDYEVMNRWAIHESRNVGTFSAEQSEFLEFHRDTIFRSGSG